MTLLAMRELLVGANDVGLIYTIPDFRLRHVIESSVFRYDILHWAYDFKSVNYLVEKMT